MKRVATIAYIVKGKAIKEKKLMFNNVSSRKKDLIE